MKIPQVQLLEVILIAQKFGKIAQIASAVLVGVIRSDGYCLAAIENSKNSRITAANDEVEIKEGWKREFDFIGDICELCTGEMKLPDVHTCQKDFSY